ncbi:MAG TPA: hypothetical protein VIX35_08225 [Vicinamibacterales bacterium]
MVVAVGRALSLVLATLAGPAAAGAQTAFDPSVTIELMGGTAYNAPTPLTIQQTGFPDIHMTAHYATKPFGPFAPYYSWRIDFWDKHGAWEVQQVHHRLFLTNTTPEVQLFEIHFGYNYFLAGRAWRTHGFVVHTSGGLVVPNPESIIRGMSLNAPGPNALDVGYRIGGVGAALAASRYVALGTHLYLLADGGLIVGRATVPVANGSASVPNVGLHGHLGVGFAF